MENLFKTDCSTCCFAQFTDNKQDGCRLNRLEKFREYNMLESATKNGKEHYLVTGVCNACRSNTWLDKHLEDTIADIYEEIKFSCDCVIVSYLEDKSVAFTNIIKSVKSCVAQTDVKPSSIFVVVKHQDLELKPLYDTLNEICGKENVPFNLTRVMEPEADYYRTEYLAVNKCRSPYFFLLQSGDVISTKALKIIDLALNVEMKKICMVEGEGTGLVLMTQIFKGLAGLVETTMPDKVRDVAKEQNCENMIFTWKDLCL